MGVDAGLGAFNGECEGVHDDDGVAVDLALHEAHDLDGAAGARVDDHLEEGECGDLHALEEVGVVGPGLVALVLALRRLVVVEDRVVRARRGCLHRDDVVLQLPCLLRYRRR